VAGARGGELVAEGLVLGCVSFLVLERFPLFPKKRGCGLNDWLIDLV
jgi:hypothetical protein